MSSSSSGRESTSATKLIPVKQHYLSHDLSLSPARLCPDFGLVVRSSQMDQHPSEVLRDLVRD
jgi:hypothetical protein